MIVSLVLAASDNEVIGIGGTLPWHLPEDLRRFRALTTGHVVVMGRVTYDSILARLGRPLPGRTSVVVSSSEETAVVPTADSSKEHRDDGDQRPGNGVVHVRGTLDSALLLAESLAEAAGDDEFFVIGGVSVFQHSLPSADRVYLTRVRAEVEGDRSMPPGWLEGFELRRSEPVSDPRAALPYEYLDYERARP
ncbi:MAG TPA: dihydrofolate reductase [Streptosporangiaceae bacterium]|nr:dihydrofolate reductase [Streptosporangiaceae bacterium]